MKVLSGLDFFQGSRGPVGPPGAAGKRGKGVRTSTLVSDFG